GCGSAENQRDRRLPTHPQPPVGQVHCDRSLDGMGTRKRPPEHEGGWIRRTPRKAGELRRTPSAPFRALADVLKAQLRIYPCQDNRGQQRNARRALATLV